MKNAENPVPDSLEMQWLAVSLLSGLAYRWIQRMQETGKSLADLL